MEKKTMKALYMDRPDPAGFRLCERPVPVLRNGEVLIKVAVCGICHTDIIIRSGTATHVIYPFVPGHEYSGTIVETGPGVNHLRAGDRGVIEQIIPNPADRNYKMGVALACADHHEMGCELDGGMAEYCAVPAQNFLPIEEHVSFSEAAFTEPLANAACAVWSGRIQPMDNVVIIGPGPIGIAAARLASFCGAGRVILTGTRDSRLAIAKENGFVEDTVNIRQPGAEEYLVNDLLGGKGADVIIEASGTLSGFETALRVIGPCGRILCEGTPPTGATLPFTPLMIPNGVSITRMAAWRDIDFYNALQFITSGKINVKPLITHEFPLEEWEAGFDVAVNHKDEAIKVMLYNR